jgi:hypothetical protein
MLARHCSGENARQLVAPDTFLFSIEKKELMWEVLVLTVLSLFRILKIHMCYEFVLALDIADL